jgi:undecaprenyl-diphosphatase
MHISAPVQIGRRQGVLACVLLAAASVITAFALADVYPPGDVTIVRAVQSVDSPGVHALSEAVYRLGVFPWLQITWLAVAACLLLFRHPVAAGMLLLGLIAYNFTFLLKELVERPRPSPLLVDVARESDSFSFPSGHVMGAVILWGLVCVLASRVIPHRPVRIAVQMFGAAVIVLMGLQRMYAGAHWPSDVLAAYLWGGFIVIAIVALSQVLRVGAHRLPGGQETRPNSEMIPEN